MKKVVSISLLLCLAAAVGCRSLNTREEVIDVEAEYLDLENRTVAVIVSTSDYVAFNYPDARATITNEICRRIITNVEGVTVTSPKDVLMWQDKNAYWATRPPSTLIRQLGVDRLILVEIGEYRTHEPGDKHFLRGIISASVNIIEAEAADPDNFGASFTKNVMYPGANESKIGEVGVGEDVVEFRTQMRFCEETAGLFYDHTIVR